MQRFFERSVAQLFKQFKARDFIIVIIILLAILSRLIGLGDRVMSHDEVNHVVPAFDLFSGRGYRHDPITHGPFQFHLMGLSYFLFGDNDFTSRLPHAIFAILTIGFVMVFFRHYLGRIGSIVAGILFTISPFMLFYGRYARNDVICVFLGIVAIYAVLRFYETKEYKFLYYLTIALALNFTSKETAYIFSAQLLIFMLILFIMDVGKIIINNKRKTVNIIAANVLLIFITLLALTISVLLFRRSYLAVQGTTIAVFNSSANVGIADVVNGLLPLLTFAGPGTALLIILAVTILFLRKYLHWDLLAASRSFSLLILVGTIVLPLLAPFLVRFAGMDPSAYSDAYVVLTNYIFIADFFIISYLLGSEWDRENWWKLAVLFYGVYIIFYTTFFTNPAGLMTGMVGSLGHWLNQQSVQRGGQPPYYYAFFLLPIYEFLPLFGAILAFYFGIKYRIFWRRSAELTNNEDGESAGENELSPLERESPPFILTPRTQVPDPAFNIFLFITSVIAFTIAGEKMPWLSLHIVFPLLLTAAWAFNILLEKFLVIFSKDNVSNFLLITGLLFNTIFIFFQVLGNKPPFQGQTQIDLQSTYRFIFYIMIEIVLITITFRRKENRSINKIVNYFALGIVLLMALITTRSAYRAAFINYDNAKEFLVYAHAADGPKMILDQVEEISKRTTNGLDIKVAYDNHGLYPFWWYLRHYSNRIVYLENPTRSLEEAPLIIAGQDKYAKLDPIVRDNYFYYEYMRLWWPMQDYWNLDWGKISSSLSNANMRQALFEIWLNRDYALYATENNNQNLTLETWLPSEKTRLYIRKDIVAEMWEYTNDEAFQQAIETDPYADKMVSRQPDGFIALEGDVPGELDSPRGIDIGPDGLIYVADSRNHRVQVFEKNGLLVNVWGTFANVLEEDAPGGTFNEPWDIAVSQDGSVYVADTFNHRVQKFDKNGRFVKMWGVFAQGQEPESFWGPRGIAVDQNGNILVTDTGNKRVVVFDSDLNFLTQFGGGGFGAGQFDEPVGITVTEENDVIIADTWNRRVQIFSVDEENLIYTQMHSFDIDGWYGQGIDNKPYLTTGREGNIFISDPEAGRILVFDQDGTFIKGFQDLNFSDDLIGYPYGLAMDEEGNLWFSDASSNIIAFITAP